MRRAWRGARRPPARRARRTRAGERRERARSEREGRERRASGRRTRGGPPDHANPQTTPCVPGVTASASNAVRGAAAPLDLRRVNLRLYDTATREVRDFVPLEEGRAGIYVCGLTVQSRAPRRPRALGGQLRRAAPLADATSGYDVHVHPQRHRHRRQDPRQGRRAGPALVQPRLRHARRAHQGAGRINVLPPTYEPGATGHVPEMVELIETSIARGHAYAAEDGSGDVYFDVRSWPAYGELTAAGHRRHGGRPRTPTRAASATPATSRCGRAEEGHRARDRRVARALGPRPAGLAHRVLGDGRQVPRRRLRHPRRRRRPALPAPRERAGPVARGRARRSRRTGCTTPGSPPPARR